jgi:hypothetical protein
MDQQPWDEAAGFEALLASGGAALEAELPHHSGFTPPGGRGGSAFVLPDGTLTQADDPRVTEQVR